MKKISHLLFCLFWLFVAIDAIGQNVHTLRIRKPAEPAESEGFSPAPPRPITNNSAPPLSSPISNNSAANKLTILNIYPDSSIFLNRRNDDLARGQGTVFFLTLYPNKPHRHWRKDTCIFTPQELKNYRNSSDSMVICIYTGWRLYNPHQSFGWGKNFMDWFAFNGNQRATQQLININEFYAATDIDKKKAIYEEEKVRQYRITFKNRKKQIIFSQTFYSNQFDINLIPAFAETITINGVQVQHPKDAARQTEDDSKRTRARTEKRYKISDLKKDRKDTKSQIKKTLIQWRYQRISRNLEKTRFTNRDIRRRYKKYKIRKLSTFSIPATNLRNFNPNR